MNKFKKISIEKFELKGKVLLTSEEKAKNIKAGSIIGTIDPCL